MSQFNLIQVNFDFSPRSPINKTKQNRIIDKLDGDADSILGTYFRLNPILISPRLYQEFQCNEFDRKLITRFRTGSNDLQIKKGRISGASRDGRLCICELDIQSLHHVLFNCPLTENIRVFHNIDESTIADFFESDDIPRIASILKAIDKTLL